MHLRVAAIAACLGAFVLGWYGLRAASPDQTAGLFPTDPPTPYFYFRPPGQPAGTALLVHGLNANKEVMQTMARALADSGIGTYAIDLPGHGDSPGAFSYDGSIRALEGVLARLDSSTILAGHSLGAALVIEMTRRNRYEKVLLLSPPPMPVTRLNVGRALVVTGSLDPPRIREFAPRLVETAAPQVEWRNFPATHSTALFDPAKLREIIGWIGTDADADRTGIRLGWFGLMAASGGIGFFLVMGTWKPDRKPPLDGRPAPSAASIVQYAAAAGVAVILLWMVIPLRGLHLFAADYLVSFVLIVGLLLWRGRRVRLDFRTAGIGLLAAAYVIAVLVLGVGSQLVHVVPSSRQWLLIPIVAGTGFPLFLHDEQTFRRMRSAWKRNAAMAGTRVILWSAVVTGVILLRQDAAFLVLVMHLVVLFWLLLWGLAGAVARSTGEPGAAALFAALVQGWVFSTLFVTI